jgi:N-acetylglucosamine-6-phosphate deacetylase
VDFSHDSETIEEGLKVVAKGLLAYGTTSFCPTLVTSSPKYYHQAILLCAFVIYRKIFNHEPFRL